MSSYLLGRKVTIFVAVMLALTLAVAAAGALSVPRPWWSWMFEHRSSLLPTIFSAWICPPLALAFVLLINPFGGFFYGGRPVPIDHRRWSDRSVVAIGLFLAAAQLIETVGLVAYWTPSLKHLIGGDPHGSRFLAFPDPDHLILRFWLAAAGALFVWVGNRLPKLSTPFKGVGQERYDWGKMARICGWIFVLGGLAEILCCCFLPFQTAAMIGTTASVIIAVFAVTLVSPLLVWCAFKFGGWPGAGVPPSKGP